LPGDGGSASYDSELTLYNNSGTILCYSDDASGFPYYDAKIRWAATFTGNVMVKVNEFPCQTNSTATTLRWRQVGSSDPCRTAINIPTVPVINQPWVCSAGNFLGTSSGASCGGVSNSYKSGNEALYTFTPVVSGNYVISISGRNRSAIFVYSGACPSAGGTCVGAVGSSSSSKSLTVNLTAGTLYYIWFDRDQSGNACSASATFSITPPVPANDNCSNATTLLEGNTIATNLSATGSLTSSCSMMDTRDVWYTYTNTSGMPQSVTVATGNSNFDPVLSLYSGTCSGLVEVFCNDDIDESLEASVTQDCVAPGQTLYVRLSGYFGDAGFTQLMLTATNDPTVPTISCPANITVYAEEGYCDAYVNYLPPWADSSGAGNYTGGGIRFEPISGSGTSVSLSDDALSGALPIGFSFNFYGNPYTNVYASSNGFLTFDAVSSNGCCFGQVIPDQEQPNNLIAFAWGDLNPTLGGSVQYFTTGAAPNRIFVINYNAIQHYGGGFPITTQIQLHEGAGVIEIHTTSKPSNGQWQTMGIENGNGLAATYLVGRNSEIWATSNEAIQFIPPNNATGACGIAHVEQLSGIGFSGFFPLGETTETYQVTDASGNTSTCSFTVTVLDNQAPFVITCPADITVVSDQPDCGGKAVSYALGFGDNCSGAVPGSLLTGLSSGSIFPVGNTAVSWQFDDGNGNTPATCSFQVNVTNNTVLSNELTPSEGCSTCSVADAETTSFYDQEGNLIMSIQDDAALPSSLGTTTVCNLASASATAPDELGDPVPVLSRFWRVNPTTNGPADITVRFTEAEYNAMRSHPAATGLYAIESLDDLCFTRYPSGTAPGFSSSGGLAVPVLSITNHGDGTITAVLDMAGFSDIYCHACSPLGGPLPLELLSFTGTQEAGVNRLKWTTANELGVSHFVVERSVDGQSFAAIGQVSAAGYSTETLYYRYDDRSFQGSGHYYRLRTIDLDGSEALSQVIYLGSAPMTPASVQLYPNPVVDQLSASFWMPSAAELEYQLVDALGRVLRQGQVQADAGALNVRMDLSDLAAGLYHLEWSNSLGQRGTNKVVVAGR